MFKCRKYRRSFTLIELSIVLSVLSLFVIMTISGASIINNANSLRIIKQISNYREAIGHFYRTYGALPGDYNDAQYKFAPSGYTQMSSRDLSTLSKDILDKIPLNGSSNGMVEGNINGDLSFHYSEVYGVWSHLGASGLIDNKYSNTCYDISSSDRRKCSKAGYNLPKIQGGYNENSSFIFYSSLLEANDARLYGAIIDQIKSIGETKSYNMLLLTDVSRSYVYNSSVALDDYVTFGAGGAVSSNIMIKIDTKIDDGMPFTGRVFGVNGGEKDNQKDGNLMEGQCNTYKGDNSKFNGDDYKSIVYTNQGNKSCVGIVLFDEFNS